MSNNGYKITHSNYVLRKKHQSVSGGTVYERDFMTTTNLGQWDSGSIPYGENNFRFVYRPTTSIRKRQSDLKWETWDASKASEYQKTSEDEPRLKPNYSSLLDFAYYGSCTELVKSTISKILSTFPPTLVVGDEYTVGDFGTARIVSNPMDMDLTSESVSSNEANPYRFMCEAYSAYTINGSAIPSFSVTPGYRFIGHASSVSSDKTKILFFKETEETEEENIIQYEIEAGPGNVHYVYRINGAYYASENGKWVVIPEDTNFVCSETGSIWNTIRLGNRVIYEVYLVDGLKLFTKTLASGSTISPSKELIDKFFDGLDDFSSLLLSRDTDPLYTARLDWPHETERGVETYKRTITWPSRDDGSLIVDSYLYGEYVTRLLDLAKFYDEYYTDNLWRMLAHDSVKNMDLTFTRPEKDEDTEDYNIGTGRMQGLLWAVGRQFDDIKREVENIKNATRITYRGDNNIPDYYLFDTLGLSGWETYDIGDPLTGVTEKVFLGSGINSKEYDYTDASVEFLKNLKLNTGNIFSRKGTKYAIENLLGMFGLVSRDFARLKYKREHNGEEPSWSEDTQYCNPSDFDYKITEYVAVAEGPKNIRNTVADWNTSRTAYPTSLEGTGYDDFYGIPVAEVVPSSGPSYIVPWFNKDEEYSGTYFQMKGGWYEETMKYLHVVDRYSDLQNVPDSKLYAHKTCYVVDSTDYDERGENHYFKKNGNEWVPTTPPDGVEEIIENFEGNNPHVGFGWYDDGQEFIDRLKRLFKYETENDSNDNPMFFDNKYDCNSGNISNGVNIGFNINGRKPDSQKVWYFHPTSTNGVCRNLNGTDTAYNTANESTHTFEVNMTPYNFEGGESHDEGAENSVINLKNIYIELYTCDYWEFKSYFEKCILPYLAQIIPSTTIFKYHIMPCTTTKPLTTVGLDMDRDVSVAAIVAGEYVNDQYVNNEENDDAVFNYRVRKNTNNDI